MLYKCWTKINSDMATISLKIRGKKNPSPLYVRFTAGRGCDFVIRTKILLNPKDWDNKKECFKQTLSASREKIVIEKVHALKPHIFDKYNVDYMDGTVINSEWLEEVILDYFKRNKETNLPNTLKYVKYVEWWLKNKPDEWITTKGKKMSATALRQYNSFLKLFKDFDKDTGYRIPDINNKVVYEFTEYMSDNGYASTSTRRHVNRMRFFLGRAKKEGIKVDDTYNDPIFINTDDQVLKPYLNFDEINTIYNYDYSEDSYMDNIRDTMIIGLWTGLRSTDLQKRLDITNIDDDFIRIKTQKTSTWVVIPLHPNIKAILDKRFGNLPARIHPNNFNKEIKKICKDCGVAQIMEGNLFKGEQNRSVLGNYPKYKLITSHTFRRSFATNLYGLVPNHVIMAVGGWSSEQMMLHYIKKTNKENAEMVKQKWDELFKLTENEQ